MSATSTSSAEETPLDPNSRAVLVHRVISYRTDEPDPTPGEPLTDSGMARRLATVFGGELRYVPDWRDWICWDLMHWRHDTDGGAAQWRAAAIGRAMLVISGMVEGRYREDWLATARRYESKSGIEAVLRTARADPQLVVYSRDLDKPLHLFNVANGTLDLSVPGLREHRPEDLMTRMSSLLASRSQLQVVRK
jgi:putative DNA primase/helicase